jgi:hypothetical protein
MATRCSSLDIPCFGRSRNSHILVRGVRKRTVSAGFAGIGQCNCWTEPWSQRVVDRSGFVNSEAPGRYVFIAITSFRVSV